MFISGPHQGTGDGPVLMVKLFDERGPARAAERASEEAARTGFTGACRVLAASPDEHPDRTRCGMRVYLLLIEGAR